MNYYYFVASSLPPLVLGESPEISFEVLIHLLQTNLNEEDWQKVKVLRLSIDLHNIRELYLGHPIDTRGNLNEKELDEALLVEIGMPDYVFEFLNQFDENKEKVRHFFGLISRYYAEEISKQSGFLHDLLVFQREVRLVLAALRAKKLGRNVVHELQFEDFSDPLVADILAQKDLPEYEPPIEYRDLKERVLAAGEDPWEQFKTVLRYEFDRIEEMSGYPLFSIDWILGYVARLMLVEKWNALDVERGKEIVKKYKTGQA